MAKRRTVENAEDHESIQRSHKRPKMDPSRSSPETLKTEPCDEIKDDDEFPSTSVTMAKLFADLMESMFDSKWETRHGSLLAVRQILISSQLSRSVESLYNPDHTHAVPVKAWLEECLIRCVCVLALDRFVDYSADGSISPVRELCAQISGVFLGCLNNVGSLLEFLRVFRVLFDGLTWHAHHGGLLGLKYLVQAHTVHAVDFVSLSFDDVVQALETRPIEEEDVLVVATEMLDQFGPYLENVETNQIKTAARLLWNGLTQEGNSGLVRAGIIKTLSAWYQLPPLATILRRDKDIYPTVWTNLTLSIPLLHHHSEFVRRSTASCVASISKQEREVDSRTIHSFACRFLPHVLLQIVVETEESSIPGLMDAWKSVVELSAERDCLVLTVSERLTEWMRLLWSSDSLAALNVDIGDAADSATSDRSMATTSLESLKGSVSWHVAFADAIAFLVSRVPWESSCMNELLEVLQGGLFSACGEMQCGCLLMLSRWAFYEKQLQSGDLSRLRRLQDRLGKHLDDFAKNHWKPLASWLCANAAPSTVLYEEQAKSVARTRQMQTRIVELFTSAGIPVKAMDQQSSSVLAAADISRIIAEQVASLPFEKLQTHSADYEVAHFKRQDLFLVDELIQQTFSRLYSRIQGLGSCAYCFLLTIPSKKSGFLVSALMESLKAEEDPVFRNLTAEALADFVLSQAATQKKCVSKIITNLCNSATALGSVSFGETSGFGGDHATSIACCSTEDEDVAALPADVREKMKVRVFGAVGALFAISAKGGAVLFDVCPVLESNISSVWRDEQGSEQSVQRSMHLITLLTPRLHPECAETHCLKWLENCVSLMRKRKFKSPHTSHLIAQAIAVICKYVDTRREDAMTLIYSRVFQVLSTNTGSATLQNNSQNVLEDAIIVLDRIVRLLKADVIPYIPSLVRYAMNTMASQHRNVRVAAARAFSELVPLIPLEMDLQEHHAANGKALQSIVQENEVSRRFLESFLRGTAIQPTDVRPWLAEGVSLRQYQQHGVDWLSFMLKNNLHVVLADDMGLGKTLQTLAAMAVIVDEYSKKKGSSGFTSTSSSVSLVVCPPIVVHHWITETKKCFADVFTRVVDYSGPSHVRKKALQGSKSFGQLISGGGHVLVVTTYAVLRSEVELLTEQQYLCAVLDEAHLVRNPSTALFGAVQGLRAMHRMALSGTPVQNHVGDLWPLFEFLMPGYLGDFVSFRREFVVPIAKSKERNTTGKQKEAAAIAISHLHERVLPFILRRTKDEVLRELPPKTISNILLPLSSVQKRLYAMLSTASPSAGESTDNVRTAHVFSDLHLLRRICVHPSLVLNERVMHSISSNDRAAARKWSSSGKLVGLRDLLVEICNVGTGDGDGGDAGDASFGDVAPHRCLVFAHLHDMLDLTEQMLRDALPRVSYRRLDGRTPHTQRAQVVQQFNDDPSIDLLLLTTAVGGLGLTLTGADTVIFLEHSWNPFVDLQAMDRAHRIGQKRAVRVFRLIMKDSLEEHILNLQVFKQRVANTVVHQNDTESSMNANTKGVLELLQTSSSAVTARELADTVSNSKGGLDEMNVPGVGLLGGAKELLDEIGEMWDEDQYSSLKFPESTATD